LTVPADVADFAQVEAAAGRIEDSLGPIDVWVNVVFASVSRGATTTAPTGSSTTGRTAADAGPQPPSHNLRLSQRSMQARSSSVSTGLVT